LSSRSVRYSAFVAFLAVFTASVAAADARQLTYIVAAGDSLWSIASANHVSVAALEKRNGLTDQSVLQIGQTLVVGDTPAHATMRSETRRSHRQAVATKQRRHGARTVSTAPAAARNALWVATHTGQAPPPPTAMTFALAQRIVAFDADITRTALRYVGVPYAWGGTSFNGVDCSGFVQAVFERNGISLPRTADSQFEVGSPVLMEDLRPGDLVFFETYTAGASHVGIFLGNGQFIHASSIGVRVDDLAEDYYAERYIGARRLIR
jgi:cell wall-associated NlpC family hydrolase